MSEHSYLLYNLNIDIENLNISNLQIAQLVVEGPNDNNLIQITIHSNSKKIDLKILDQSFKLLDIVSYNSLQEMFSSFRNDYNYYYLNSNIPLLNSELNNGISNNNDPTIYDIEELKEKVNDIRRHKLVKSEIHLQHKNSNHFLKCDLTFDMYFKDFKIIISYDDYPDYADLTVTGSSFILLMNRLLNNGFLYLKSELPLFKENESCEKPVSLTNNDLKKKLKTEVIVEAMTNITI